MVYIGVHLIGLAVLSLFIAARYVQRRRALRNLAMSHGCKTIRQAHNKLPFGLDRKYEILTHKGNGLDGLLIPRFQQVGGYIYQDASWVENPPILCAEPDAIKSILSTNFQDWIMETYRFSALSPWIGIGIFNSSHDGINRGWSPVRAAMRPCFAREDLYNLKLLESDIQNFFQVLGSGVHGWTTASDLHPLIRRFSIDTITSFFCGGCVGCQGNSPKFTKTPERLYSAEIEAAFDECNKTAAKRFRVPPLYWLFNPKSFQEGCRLFKTFGSTRVDKAIVQLKATGPDAVISEADVVPFLMSKLEDRTMVGDILSQMLFAGVDSTTSMLCFTLLELARTPGAWDRLRAELESNGMGSDPGSITVPKLKSCRFLQNCLTETLRLYPGVPFNSREAVRDTVLPVGGGPDGKSPVVVTKGTVVRYSAYVMHRRKDLYGEDALEWKPDRWNGRRPDWGYVPFNGGPRICLGQKFSLLEGAYFVARLAQHYDKVEGSFAPADAPIPSRIDTVLFPQQGVPLRYQLAKAEL
ncbi:Cytochrome P450 CYP52T1 [Penicillium sp. IBT 35674x]|nr:Cytochrome P450 CYP52T1 [Penicillium sp. IBT 35674x]